MAVIHTISCDICGIVKREANHWFTFVDQTGQLTFFPWSESEYLRHHHLCSERCCMTVLSRTLAAWGGRAAAPRTLAPALSLPSAHPHEVH